MEISMSLLRDKLCLSEEATERLLDLLQINFQPTIELPSAHPLCQSLKLCRANAFVKPLYTLQDLSKLYAWHKQDYSVDSVMLKLQEMDVKVYSRGAGSKGWVYLSDLLSAVEKTVADQKAGQ